MRRLLITVGFVAVCSSAGAFELTPAARAALDGGRPYVEVRASPDAGSEVVRAAIDIAAPPATIWRVLTDCALAARLSPNMKTCRVLERDPAGRWELREQVSRRTVLPPIRNVYRQDYDPPHRISFRRTAGDLRVFEGEWRMTPIGDNVRVTYEARVTAPFSTPDWIARAVLRQEIPRALLALRREATSLSDARQRVAANAPPQGP